MKKVVVVVDANLNENIYGGKSIRTSNIFSRLSKFVDLVYIPLLQPDQIIPEYIKSTFSRIEPIRFKLSPRPSLNKIKTILEMLPGYYFPLSYPEIFRGIESRLFNVFKKNKPSIVHIFDFYIGSCLVNLSKQYKTIWDIGDSFWLIEKRSNQLNYDSFRIRNYEYRLLKAFDKTVFVGKGDFEEYNKKLRDKIELIPIGIDDSFLNYNYSCNKPEQDTIIFSGNMSYGPNSDTVKYFYQTIWLKLTQRRPDLKWYIVGTSPEIIGKMIGNNKNIVITGKVFDIKPYLARAKIYVAPIRYGGGMKNKLLEAMAMQKIIIASPRAVEGFMQGHNMHVVESPDKFLQLLLQLLSDKQDLDSKNRNFVTLNYTWDKTVEKYLNLYDELL